MAVEAKDHMTPPYNKRGVEQTRFGGPEKPPEERGNCFAACLATILEVPLEELPEAAADESGWGRLIDWLGERGLGLAEVRPHNPYEDGYQPGWTILGVESKFIKLPEGGGHVVVGWNSWPYWNPNPWDRRSPEELSHTIGAAYVLYPLDPAAVRPVEVL